MSTGVKVALGAQPSAAAVQRFEREHEHVGERRQQARSSTQRLCDLACLTVVAGIEITWLGLLGYGAYRLGLFGIVR